MMVDLSPADVNEIRSSVLTWAETALRDLPWRQIRDPYRVWISEVMLQQTRVETVIPYYLEWMKQFPTLHALARADLGQVLKAWEGLGYYARCRNLHRAAQMVVEEHGGRLPETREELLALPGIGPYTVGAILSLAFDRDAAVLDGNVRRVLSRLFAIDDDPRQAQTRERMWARAEALVPPGQAGRFNEAMMDLGARVCTPRSPHCGVCPLNSLCQAFADGNPEDYPPSRRRRPMPHYNVTAGVIWQDDHVLIAQRPLDGLLGGLWEFPGGKQQEGETLCECLKRELREELDIEVEVGEQLTVVHHAFTHFRITVYAFECRYLSPGEPKALGVDAWHWVTPDELDDYALPVVDRKIAVVISDSWRQPRLM
jgi:A/G-specific adenine glycosylase